MSTLGAWPLDPTTITGLFRFEVGDVVGTPATATSAEASYEFMSDETIDALILAYPNIAIAKSKALMSMATQLIAAAQDIVVDDIKIKTVERANLMFGLATTLNGSAFNADNATAFGVVPLVSMFGNSRSGLSGF